MEHKRNGSRFLKAQVFRIRHAIYLRNAHEFRATAVDQVAKIGKVAAAIVLPGEACRAFPARNARRKHHFLPDSHGRDIRATLCDFARDVTSRNVRQRNWHAMDAETNPEIETIQRAGLHPYEHFVRAYDRVGDVGVLENLWPAVLMKDDCFHESSAPSNRVRKVAFRRKSVQKPTRIDSKLSPP